MADYSFDNKTTFVNPYTFVRAPRNIERGAGPDEEGSVLHTGVLHCRLTLRTPLIIPDTANKEADLDEKDHYIYPFMKINNQYLIPGSSIRGPVRSVFEAAVNACFATAKQDHAITARTNAAFKPGLLVKCGDTFSLFQAERYVFRVEEYKRLTGHGDNALAISKADLKKYQYGQKVNFSCVAFGETEYRNKRGFLVGKYVWSVDKPGDKLTGYLYRGEFFSRKHFESIFKDTEIPVKGVSAAALHASFEKLLDTLDVYRDDKVNRNLGQGPRDHSGYAPIDPGKLKAGDFTLPVWYRTTDTDKVYLSFACIGRFGYENSMNAILGERKACTDRRKLCEACALFGMIGQNGGEGYGSKVRFSDAVYTGNSAEKLPRRTLRELGTPKTSYLPFYVKSGNLTQGYDADGVDIRGRKFYWHHYPDKVDVPKNNMNATFEVLPQGEFLFDVYYDQITDDQQKKLAWALCLGENTADSRFCHKFGHGKPLGFGSAKVTIYGIEERTYQDGSYTIDMLPVESVTEGMDSLVFKGSKTELLIAADFDAVKGGDVRYPYVINATDKPDDAFGDNILASHKWFSNNYKFGTKDAAHPLPLVTARDQSLPVLKLTGYTDKDLNKGGGHAGKAQPHKDDPHGAGKKTVPKVGDQLSGTITGMNPQRTSTFVRTDNGKSLGVFFKNTGLLLETFRNRYGTEGTRVKVQFLGYNEQNGKKYEKWTFV